MKRRGVVFDTHLTWICLSCPALPSHSVTARMLYITNLDIAIDLNLIPPPLPSLSAGILLRPDRQPGSRYGDPEAAAGVDSLSFTAATVTVMSCTRHLRILIIFGHIHVLVFGITYARYQLYQHLTHRHCPSP
jgi:hypothetical protein